MDHSSQVIRAICMGKLRHSWGGAGGQHGGSLGGGSWAGLGTKALCWGLVYWLWLYTEGGDGAGGCVGWMCHGWVRSDTVQRGRSGGCKHRMDVSGTSCGRMCYRTAGSTGSLLQPSKVLGGAAARALGIAQGLALGAGWAAAQ